MHELVAGGITDGALAWAARNELAARALRPALAMQGDLHAQRLLVGELLEDVRGGRTRAHDDLDLMSTLRVPEFLAALFEILEKMYPLGWRYTKIRAGCT
ncbi:MAG: hypothetical protein LC790_19200 [Actinobacteria bacterium]|nr:hypothetical protein [Actinomycetota bacterium]